MKAIFAGILTSVITLQLHSQILLQDDFAYADGALTNVSAGLWARHSGTVSDALVSGGKLQIFGARSEDVNRALTNTPGTILYASFILRNTTLPTAGGAYFAHFKDNGTANFRARTWALAPAGTTPGAWRLGITAAGNTPIQVFPLDLATNVDYRVVISYDTVNFLGTLFVDPVGEADTKSQTIDSTAALVISTFAFRQASGEGSLTIDDLFVANSFAEVNVGATKAATIYYEPQPAVTVDETATTNLFCVAGGAGTVTFQWLKNGGELVEDGVNIVGVTSNRLYIAGATSANAGNYRCVVTSTTNGVFSGSVTSAVSVVTINTTPIPPFITTQPVGATNTIGSPATLTVSAGGSQPLSFEWNYIANGTTNVVGGEATLQLPTLDATVAGDYYVRVSNAFGQTNSQIVTVVAIPPIATNIAYLRTLQNPTTRLPTNTTTIWQAEGVVTTRTNTTGLANTQIYIQDETAGIVVFVGGLSGATQPQAGDRVRVVGPLGSFNSVFEFNLSAANPYHSLTVLSTGNPMPAAKTFNDFSITNNLNAIEALEGSLVTITDAHFLTGGSGANFSPGGTVVISNSVGQTLAVFINGTALPTPGIPVPATVYQVTGVLGQFLSETAPDRTVGYQIIPTAYAYIVTTLPPSPDLAITQGATTTTLSWTNVDGSTYTIYKATDGAAGPYAPIASGLNYLTNEVGTFTATNAGPAGFFRASSP
jgi:hypothetical protein